MLSQPINHDLLFKWLIRSFLYDFFDWYFPEMPIRNCAAMDKEFYSAFEQITKSRTSDLFLVAEVEIEGVDHEVVIIIEHKSWKEDVRKQVMDYCCYAWLKKRRPVWPIVFFTDKRKWKKDVDHRIWFSFSKAGKQYVECDIIKLNREHSKTLLAHKSLLLKLLALKADATGCRREEMIREIFKTVEEQKATLGEEKMALVAVFVDAYAQIPKRNLARIRKEVEMIAGDTITEHYQLIGKEMGRIEGLTEGLSKGRIEGAIENLGQLLAEGFITKEVYAIKVQALKAQLVEKAEAGST